MADPVSTTLSLAQMIIPSVEPVIRRLLQERKEREQMEKGLEREIPRLFSTMQALKDLLHDADKKQGQDASLRSWLLSLKEVVSDAEDVLDEYATDVAIWQMESDSQLENSDGWRAKVSRSLTCFYTSQPDIARPVKINKLKFVKYIGIINRKLDDIYKKRLDLGLQVLPGSNQNFQRPPNSLGWRKTTSIPDHFQSQGREEVKRVIIEKLLHQLGKQRETSSSHQDKVSHILIIPVVGMGGLGKTTLARSIFNDDDVKFHFGDSRTWVCVSGNSDVENLTKTIIESIYCSQGKDQTYKWNDLENMQKELVNLIEGKRFLLILDDVWSENMPFWDLLLKPIRAVKSGCQCVVYTSRIANIRKSIGGCLDNIVLKGLNDEHVWKVFHMYAFEGVDENDSTYRQLESIGKTIITRLKGSPLAAKSIGRLLSTNSDPKYWRDVSKTDLLKIGQENEDIFGILFLSYQHLPVHLKQCLIYFSLFPKAYIFREYEMINLWMANGCIHKYEGSSLEDVGKVYLKALVDRSFLEQCHDRYSYAMHDLVHDMVLSISKHDCYWLHDSKKVKGENPMGHRHVSVITANRRSFINEMCGDNSRFERTRTMLFNEYKGFYNIRDVVGHLFKTMRYLRALVLRRCAINVLPDSIYDLKHLRLLDISYSSVEVLSKSLSNLYNLNVLNLYGCERIKCLPNTTSRLVNLRHLIGNDEIISSLKGIGRLRELQSSILFIIRDEDGFCISELKDLNLLNERLIIQKVELVKEKEDALEAQLEKKEDLKSLVLEWTITRSDNKMSNERSIESNRQSKVDEDVLEALKPCEGLVEICIIGYIGVNAPGWLNESWLGSLEILKMISCSRLQLMPPIEAWVNSLRVLELVSCTKLENLSPHIGKLELLKVLHLKSLHSLKEITWEMVCREGGECCLFKSLVSIAFDDMSEWVEWRVNRVEEVKQESVSIFPELKEVYIRRCPKLDYVDVPVLAMMIRFPNTGTMGTSTSYGRNVDESIHRPYVSNSLASVTHVEICECSHITSCELLPTMTCLKHVVIQDCQRLTCLVLPTSAILLEQLRVQQCPKLELCKLPSPPNGCKGFSMSHRNQITCLVLNWPNSWCIDFPLAPNVCYFSSTLVSSPQTVVDAHSKVQSLVFPLSSIIQELELSNFKQKEVAVLLTRINACSMIHLTKLEIRGCPDLEQIEGHDGLELALPASLTVLHLARCSQLKLLPPISPTLEVVMLFECPLLARSLDLSHFTSLKMVYVSSCPSVASLLFPPSISNSLTISSCPNIQHLISSGPNPSSASLSNPSLLQVMNLEISCSNRDQLTTLLQQIQPAQLKQLRLSHCSDLEHFGAQLGPTLLSFTYLTDLWIEGFENLRSLPSALGTQLLHLEYLFIETCPLLSCLPDLRPLTSLTRLCVKRCPKLMEKYNDDIKSQAFSHIPSVRI